MPISGHTHPRSSRGFTLLELVIVLVVIGVVSAIGVPRASRAVTSARVNAAAAEFRGVAEAFQQHFDEVGEWPADAFAGQAVPEMGDRLDRDTMRGTTPFGGTYDWSTNYGSRACLGVYQFTMTTEELEAVDALLDDGVLATGKVRVRLGQFQYILEW